MTDLLAGVVQILGLVMVVVGVFMLSVWLGWVVAGVATTFVGIRIEIAK